MKYKGKELKGPFPAMGITRLKNGKFVAFVVQDNTIMRGEPRVSYEQAHADIQRATFLSRPARVYI